MTLGSAISRPAPGIVGAALLMLAWPALAAAPLAVTEVAPGLFVHPGVQEDFTPENAGGIANLAFVIGQDGVAVIDSGGSRLEGEALLAAIRARSEAPIRFVIATHGHPDHVLGSAAFVASGAVFAGHAKLAAQLAEAGPYYLAAMQHLLGASFAGSEIVPPTLPVADRLRLDLGDRPLELRAWPTAHTSTDLTVLDVRTGTLLAGDLVVMERLPVVDGSLLGWLGIMDELATLPAVRVVPGHGPVAAAWPQAMAPQRAYLAYLRDRVREALRRNRTLEQAVEEIAPPPGSSWLLMRENHARNVTASYTELEWE